MVAVDGEDGQVYAGERIEEVGAGGGGGLEDLVGLGFLCLCSAALLGGALLGTFLGLGALGTRLGGEALVGKVSPDIVTNPKLHRPGPQREPASSFCTGFGGRAYFRETGRQRGGRDHSAWEGRGMTGWGRKKKRLVDL